VRYEDSYITPLENICTHQIGVFTPVYMAHTHFTSV